MLTQGGMESKSRNIPTNLQINPPADWTSKAIVYVRYSLEFVEDSSTGLRWLKLFQKVGPIKNTVLKIEDAIRLLGERKPIPNNGYSSGGGTNPAPLKYPDINVPEQSYVLIELDEIIDWQFRTGGAGITYKDDTHGDSDVGLIHINFDAAGLPIPNSTPHDKPVGNGCRLVYFKTVRRGAYDMHPMNFHVELVQRGTGGYYLECIFDPDIGNNGGSPYP